MEHWECKGCKALTPLNVNECWRCLAVKGSDPSPKEVVAGKARAHAQDRERNPRVLALANAQFWLQIAACIFVASLLVMVEPVYCLVVYSGGCPSDLPEIELFILAASPLLVVAVDLILIYHVAPQHVPIEFAERFMRHERPKFLLRWYSGLLVKSYNRK
jgi:hypothetical protein